MSTAIRLAVLALVLGIFIGSAFYYSGPGFARLFPIY